MPRITEYCVVLVSQSLDLEREVSSLIQYGWQPYGYPIVRGDGIGLVQAMVKYEEVPNANSTE